jgi:4-hydroxybenzoate polyprenyltransferase
MTITAQLSEKSKLFFALSRTQHILIDIATPAVCALLLLGHFPSLAIIIIGLITAFAGYNAIYALNDLIGYKIDRAKMADTTDYEGYSVESSDYRHPIAQGLLSTKAAGTWIGFWAIIALAGAYWLNPVTIFILLLGGILEAVYCLLLKVSHWRIIISGIVKACGPIAAVFAVSTHPSISLLITLFFWVFFWELGGQNMPADWTDIEEDKRADSKTTPIKYGVTITSRSVIVTLTLTLALLSYAFILSPIPFSLTAGIASIVLGAHFLIYPAIQLYQHKTPKQAAKLFSKASYYPLSILIILGILIMWCNHSYVLIH